MGLDALLDRLESEVPPVPSVREPEGTAKPELNQRGSLGSLGSLEKTNEARKIRIWRIHHADGRWDSHSFTPPATLEEVRRWHPSALEIRPDEVGHGG